MVTSEAVVLTLQRDQEMERKRAKTGGEKNADKAFFWSPVCCLILLNCPLG